MDQETCCLPYEELCRYLHTNPETFRRAWKELPHFYAPGTEGYNLKAARFDLLDVVAYLKRVGRTGRQQPTPQAAGPAAKKMPRGSSSRAAPDDSQTKKWRVSRWSE